MHRVATGRADSGVVGTLMSNMGLELALAEHGIKLERAKVGDRHVKELMQQQGWHLGGESSGHLICSDVSTTGDGIVSALQVLAAMVDAQKSLRELLAGMVKLPQVLLNVPVTASMNLDSPAIQGVTRQVEEALHGRGRLLLRPSGTEPVIRVMVEGDSLEEIQAHAQRVADVLTAVA
jgi:phosphoglucosamine mutase